MVQSTPIGGLDGFSVERIIELFARIDEQILGLHQCSSDDFLGLNSKFKGFYKEAKGISTSAGSLFLLFSEGANRKLISQLESFYRQLARNQRQVTDQLTQSLSSMEMVRGEVRALYLPLRNTAQNLGTVSLLLANLNLGYRAVLEQEGFTPADLSRLRGEVDASVEQSVRLVHYTNELIRRLDRGVSQVAVVKQKTLGGLEMVINALHYGLILFAEKHEEANLRIPEISAKTDSCSRSIAGIITNLQYQDIIRQKMEHIQEAHQHLMDELGGWRRGEELRGEERLRMLVQVRDIAALQSAQLVATNREYQGAIELIAQSFRDIARDMEAIAALCRDTLLAAGEALDADSSTTISALLQRLKRSGNTLGELAECIFVFQAELQEAIRSQAEFQGMLHDAHQRLEGITARVRHEVIDRLGDMPGEGFGSVLSQLSLVVADLDGFDAAVSRRREVLVAQRRRLVGFELGLADMLPLWNDFKEGAEQMHDIGLGLAHTEQESKALLSEIETMSKKVSLETQGALGDIKYYDFFERVIMEIIDGLNTLSKNIRDEVGAELAGDIEGVRQLYTMASEHRIHDSFSGSERGDVDLFGDGIVGENAVLADEGDDGLELF